MNRMDLAHYEEVKPQRIKRVLWVCINKCIFPFFPSMCRNALLRLFGARVGMKCLVYGSVKVYAPWNLSLGDYVCIGPRAEIFSKGKVAIGSGVVISQDAYICTGTHDISSPRLSPLTAPVVVCDNVWVAAKAAVLPGVTINEGCVVGACAVVSRSTPSWTIVAGNPARPVGERKLVD